MTNCGNHPSSVFGESDMKKVAEAIGDLNYETLAVLIDELSKKLKQDSRKDLRAGRIQLANRLRDSASFLKGAYARIQDAYQISKPFMKPKEQK